MIRKAEKAVPRPELIACHGRRSIIEHPCSECHGSGDGVQKEELTVKIPRGVEEGMALRIPGQGLPSPETGGSNGDLFVVVHSQKDPRYERSGADLLFQESISLTDAVLGASLDVPTLEGAAQVVIPLGTQPGTVLRLKGKGLPEFGGNRKGKLYLQLRVQIPTDLSDEERRLYERLREISAAK